jgi:hypothetical protein
MADQRLRSRRTMLELLTTLVVLTAASPACSGAHPADVEARLASLIGDWTVEGHEKTFVERCEWFGDRAFVVCSASDSSDGSMSRSILGYSRPEGRFTYFNYSGKGGSRSEAGFPHGDRGLVYVHERSSAEGHARTTTVLAPLADGRMHFRKERSVNGGPWGEVANFHYVRLLAERK